MLTKVYGLLWLATAVFMMAAYLTGNLGTNSVIVFGFIIFGLLYMGLISVLPFWATHNTSTKH
jgi:hypothetical protein